MSYHKEKELDQYNCSQNTATPAEKKTFACAIFEVRSQNYHSHTHTQIQTETATHAHTQIQTETVTHTVCG